MKLVRFAAAKSPPRLGLTDDTKDRILDVELAQELRGGDNPRVDMDAFLERTGESLACLERLWQDLDDVPQSWVSASSVRLLCPIPRPGKIVALGLNYREHAEEQKLTAPQFPLIFAKFPSAVIGPEEAIVLPSLSQ